MSDPHLPPEILDHILDLLHDRPEALKVCCLVSKSWVPRARRHLFVNIWFHSMGRLESWRKIFPDPANSPAHHTNTLSIGSPQVAIAANEGAGSWIQAFSRVASLNMCCSLGQDLNVSLAPFLKFSPTLKSLRTHSIVLPCPHLFNLICSSPLLEDLTLTGEDRDNPHRPQTVVPSTSPAFTGSLELSLFGGMGSTARRLLDLPNGVHFRRLTLSLTCVEDLRWTMELVARCSGTLECLDVKYYLHGTSVSILCWSYNLPLYVDETSPVFIDLSKAAKLQDVIFRLRTLTVDIEWITLTLQTVTPDLRQISIQLSYDFAAGQTIGDPTLGLWLDLDRLLSNIDLYSKLRTDIYNVSQGPDSFGFVEGAGEILP